MVKWPVSAVSFSCCLLLTTWSLVDGQAVISLLEPLQMVAHRPGRFSLTVHKTGRADETPPTIIVEVCYLHIIIILYGGHIAAASPCSGRETSLYPVKNYCTFLSRFSSAFTRRQHVTCVTVSLHLYAY